MSVESDCVHGVGLCTQVDATGEHQTRWDKASKDMIHKSTVETDDRQLCQEKTTFLAEREC